MREESFIDELLAEAEATKQQQRSAYYDLFLIEISELEAKLREIDKQANQEVQIIMNWADEKKSALSRKIEHLKSNLESMMREDGLKTIDLPHGIMKIRKSPDKVEVKDLELFMNHANKEIVKIIPEQIKPDLRKIHNWIKMTKKIPQGVELIEGKESFKITIKEVNHGTES